MSLDKKALHALRTKIKFADSDSDDKQEDKPKRNATPARKRRRPSASPAFPEFDRSLVAQFSENPIRAGARRGLGGGALGAVLGALAGRMISDDPKHTGMGAVGGGLLGGGVGFHSGRREAESDRSRLLFLRRLGITRPGELEALLQYPELTGRVTREQI